MAQEKSQSKQVPPSSPRLPREILPSEKILAQEQKRLNDLFIEAVRHGNNTEMLQLLKAGADIAAKYRFGSTDVETTAIEISVTCNHPQTCALLIEEHKKAGRDIKALLDERDQWKRTPLHLAARLGHADVCYVLILNGADVNATDEYNGTPLHEAIIMNHKGCLNIEMILLAAGANPDIERNVDHSNVWDLADGNNTRTNIYDFYQFSRMFSEDAAKAFGMNFLECVSF
jgi:ankyrin repeat protein